MLGLLTGIKKEIKIIALSGKAGSGKDFIASQVFPRYFRIAFADHFKHDVVGKGILTHEQVYVTKDEEVRHRLQQFGTEEGRDVYGENVWIHCLEAWIYSMYMKNKIVRFVITDCRFDNEAQWVKDVGGTVIQIKSDRDLAGMDENNKKHISEAGINDSLVDCIVYNNYGTTKEEIANQLSNYTK